MGLLIRDKKFPLFASKFNAGVAFWYAPFSSIHKLHTEMEYPFVYSLVCTVHLLACITKSRGCTRMGKILHLNLWSSAILCKKECNTPNRTSFWPTRNNIYSAGQSFTPTLFTKSATMPILYLPWHISAITTSNKKESEIDLTLLKNIRPMFKLTPFPINIYISLH